MWVAVLGLGASGVRCSSPARDPHVGTSPASAREPGALTLPNVTTPASALAPEGYTHVEVFRIRRDFGNSEFEIALDAWLPGDEPTTIDDVRLWWLKTDRNGERGPFSQKTGRHFDIGYERRSEGHWVVQLIAGADRRFTFSVEADGTGGVFAYATVVVPSGERVERCRVQAGVLRATKVFALTTGIKELNVTCTDQNGAQHEGNLES